MTNSKLLQEISNRDSDKERIVARAIPEPQLLSEIFEGLNARKASTKYGCDKVLRIISVHP